VRQLSISGLAALAPQRVWAIVKSAQKVSADPQSLQAADYDDVRAQGVSDKEIMDIITLAALGNYLDTVVDAMKIQVDDVFKEALAG